MTKLVYRGVAIDQVRTTQLEKRRESSTTASTHTLQLYSTNHLHLL